MKVSLNDEMKPYLKEVSCKKVLSREEEIALFRRLERNDPTARKEIVEANLRFVIKVALGFAGRGVPLADLIQEGNIGLLEVVDKFDYRKGYRFSTYAAFWIRQAIQMAVRKQCNVIRLPIRKSRFLGHLSEKIRDFSQCNGRQPTTRELATQMDMDESKLEHLMSLRDSVLSLEMETDGDGTQLLNTIRDHSTPSPVDKCMELEKSRHVAKVLDLLSEKEQRVLKLRYGLETGKHMSLRTTSRIIGMSQEGVRRVERKALTKLRRPAARQLVCGLL